MKFRNRRKDLIQRSKEELRIRSEELTFLNVLFQYSAYSAARELSSLKAYDRATEHNLDLLNKIKMKNARINVLKSRIQNLTDRKRIRRR